MEKCKGVFRVLKHLSLKAENLGVRCKKPFENQSRVNMSKISLNPMDLKIPYF